LKQLRDVEDRSVTNGRLERVRQWALLRDTNALGLHRRPELDPQVPPEPVKPHLPHSLFSCFDQKLTLQCESFWAPATWPTLTAQTYQPLAPENVIMHECALTHSWELADRAWRSVFVQAGSVLEAQNSGDVLLATGHVQFLAHTAWELENFFDSR
jgi:hypothetical protein